MPRPASCRWPNSWSNNRPPRRPALWNRDCCPAGNPVRGRRTEGRQIAAGGEPRAVGGGQFGPHRLSHPGSAPCAGLPVRTACPAVRRPPGHHARISGIPPIRTCSCCSSPRRSNHRRCPWMMVTLSQNVRSATMVVIPPTSRFSDAISFARYGRMVVSQLGPTLLLLQF